MQKRIRGFAKFIKGLVIVIGLVYLISSLLFYFFQEKIIFHPEVLDSDHVFHFEESFEEINITTHDGVVLNNLLFKADSSIGLVFFLHGNGGSLERWGNSASVFLDNHYDVLMLDYRGYGKSEGKMINESQLYYDNQLIYNEALKRYDENKIIVLGYSIGTGPAAKIASANNPRLLILQAPYYNIEDLITQILSEDNSSLSSFLGTLPTSTLLKYTFTTNEFVKECSMPIVLFHGDADQVIYYGSSLKLQSNFKPNDTLITLQGFNHNGITENQDYVNALEEILSAE